VYNHLIAADNLLDQVASQPEQWVEAVAGDFNFDARPEIQLRNNRLLCLLAPSFGGHLYELDIRSICHNLGATLNRRPEAYHRKVLSEHGSNGQEVASIHDRIVFKQADLDQRIQYDTYPRKSLVDHFFGDSADLDSFAHGNFPEEGDFVLGVYESRLRRNPDRVQAQLSRAGRVADHPVQLTKAITLEAGSSMLEIAYLLEGLPSDRELHFGCELNFAGLPAGADDRYFSSGSQRLGQLGHRLDLANLQEFGLTDEWLGLTLQLNFDRETNFWTCPVETVSQSEGGFELVHQAVTVVPHWRVRADQNGCWTVKLRLGVDTRVAEGRMEPAAVALG
jgi:alpha-amylase